MTDACTGMNSETGVAKNETKMWVLAGIEEAEERLPFTILGIDSENRSELINNHLLRLCVKNNIMFTRIRPYQKNDNCSVK